MITPANNTFGRSAGFTLIEVVIALAILGTSLFVLLQSQYVTLDLFSTSREAADFEMIAAQAVALAEIDILTGEEQGEGDFGDLLPDYSYEYETEFIDDIELPGLMDVTLTIYGPGLEKELRFRVHDGVQTQTAR